MYELHYCLFAKEHKARASAHKLQGGSGERNKECECD
jgi:hypothetical protein